MTTPTHPDRPENVQVRMSRLTITNSRVERKCSYEQLEEDIQPYIHGQLYDSKTFPRFHLNFI